ncbi:MAG: PIN domain-containing protein [Patescibacteria group bacterium]
MVVVDTSVVIDHLRRPPEESILIKLIEDNMEETFGISVVSVQELYVGRSTKDEAKERQLLSTLGSLEILSYNLEVAKLAGMIARDSKDLVDFADAAIAATTIAAGGKLFTLNKKHFKGILNLSLFNI